VEEEQKARIALNAVPGLGLVGIQKMMQAAGSAVAVCQDSQKWWPYLRRRPRCPGTQELQDLGERQCHALHELGATVIFPEDAAWPQSFCHLGNPPLLLYCCGSLQALNAGQSRAAVIGARACTTYGKDQAHRFGLGLSHGGVSVVSGAARGVDQAGMRGGLEGGRPVMGVLGSGLYIPYPTDATPLLQEIMKAGGCVLSEFAFGTRPQRGNFPRRNRLIAALSQAVVVVQASLTSGSLNTVGEALGLGVEIFAVPGPVGQTTSQGTHQLLRDGCALAESPQEILAFLGIMHSTLDVDIRSPLYRVLEQEEISLDALAEEVGMEPALVQMELLEMELRGRVIQRPGGLYRLVGPCREPNL